MTNELKPYQQRLIDEYAELKNRSDKLTRFINLHQNNPTEHPLDCPIDLMIRQERVMREYADILRQRLEMMHVINLTELDKKIRLDQAELDSTLANWRHPADYWGTMDVKPCDLCGKETLYDDRHIAFIIHGKQGKYCDCVCGDCLKRLKITPTVEVSQKQYYDLLTFYTMHRKEAEE